MIFNDVGSATTVVVKRSFAEFMSYASDEAANALRNFPSDSDDHLTQRGMRAARLVKEMSRHLGGLTKARMMLQSMFTSVGCFTSERSIRRCEFINTIPDVAVFVLDGRIVIDTAEKIMKSSEHSGFDVLLVAWLSASPRDRDLFVEAINPRAGAPLSRDR